MSVIPIRSEASSRGARMLRTALGPEIAAWLEDASVIEVMLNPDGRLWIDRLGAGIADTGSGMSAADGERIIRLVAHHVGAEVHAKAPRVSAELPDTGERFEGLLPPVVAAPSFAIRKPAVAVFTLGDYVAAGIMFQWQAETLVAAVSARKNILVAGGTSAIVKAFERLIAANGGHLRTGCHVEAIETVAERARGVLLASGERLVCKKGVIANVTPTALYGASARSTKFVTPNATIGW